MLPYDIAFSFAGEDRPFVETIKNELVNAGYKVFYDQDQQGQLWGKDLTVELPKHYYASRYVVMFIDDHYVSKMWTYFERQLLILKHLREKGPDYLLPVYLNGFAGEVPGLSGLVAYVSVDANEAGAAILMPLITQKLGPPGP